MSQSFAVLAFVRLFRVWAAARQAGNNPLPHMQRCLELCQPTPELGVACASLFDLVEAHLERRLVPECCCNRDLSRDELALLGVLRHARRAGIPLAEEAIPHGLPGAIRWAAFAVQRAFGRSFGEAFERDDTFQQRSGQQTSGICPFSAPVGSEEPTLVMAPSVH